MLLRALAVVSAAIASLALAAPRAEAASTFRAHWMLDEVGGATAFDSSANGNDGINVNIVGDGTGYTFNGVNSRVVVPSSNSLNPGPASFSWGVTLAMPAPPSAPGDTFDILRKGLVTTKGGDYKLEVKNVQESAVARCVAQTVRGNGSKVLAAIQSSLATLADNKPHTVTCTKTSTSISVKVDSRALRTKTFTSLGSVSNTAELALGAKAETTAQTGFDWFAGEISDAWVA